MPNDIQEPLNESTRVFASRYTPIGSDFGTKWSIPFKNVSFPLDLGQKKGPVINAKEVAVENRAEETYYHRTLSFITELPGKR
jgi:hypothetical protein